MPINHPGRWSIQVFARGNRHSRTVPARESSRLCQAILEMGVTRRTRIFIDYASAIPRVAATDG